MINCCIIKIIFVNGEFGKYSEMPTPACMVVLNNKKSRKKTQLHRRTRRERLEESVKKKKRERKKSTKPSTVAAAPMSSNSWVDSYIEALVIQDELRDSEL